MKTIIAVCNGNIQRSVIAALAIQKVIQVRNLEDRYRATSRGLQGSGGTPMPLGKNLRDYPIEWNAALPALQEFGVVIPANQTTMPITRADVDAASLILAMDKQVLSEKDNSLLRQFPDLATKLHLFSEIVGRDVDILDPFGEKDPKFHRNMVKVISSIVDDGFDELIRLIENS